MAPNFKTNGKKSENGVGGHAARNNTIGRYFIKLDSKNHNHNNNHHNSHNHGSSGHNNNHEHANKRQKLSPNRAQHRSQEDQLPVFSYRSTFSELLNENKSLLVIGETGSGKTTQIPQWCLEYCLSRTKKSSVACTQPRRIAAMSIAERVAKEMREPLGGLVGYSVRFESNTSDKTRLKYLTDGMLLREAMLDETLSAYGVIILDEAHERTLQTEILFGVVKRAFVARNNNPTGDNKGLLPLKVIIMSATINVKLFRKYFESPILHIKGRQHPVQDLYAEVPQSDLLTATLVSVFQIHRTCDEGDILVFCSGQDEIQSLITLTKRVLKQAPESLSNLHALPLYAALPAGQQMKVFLHKPAAATAAHPKKSPNKLNGSSTNGYHKTNGAGKDSDDGSSSDDNDEDEDANSPRDNDQGSSSAPAPTFTRRVIYATNVAETSITIPNIKYVIDTGKVKCRNYCPKTGTESLKVTSISKAQAKQRAGRAGRVAPGTCYHLYTNDDYANLVDYLPPEIRRCNLDGVILQMISIGIRDLNSFDFLEKPDESRLKAALVNLLHLKAIKPVQVGASADSGDKSSALDGPAAEAAPASANKKHKSNNNLNLLATSNNDHAILSLSYDLTPLGKKLCLFPLNPAMARILVAAHELHCLDEALTVVSLLAIENLFHIPPNKQSQAETMLRRFHSNEGDAIMLLNVYRAFKRTLKLNKTGAKFWCTEHYIHLKNLKMAIMIRKQLSGLCKSANMGPSSCGQDTSVVRRALTYGLHNNVATMFDGKYRTRSSVEVHIHPQSCLFKARPECIIFVEVVETNKCYMRTCTLVDINWVREVSASNMKQSAALAQ